MGALSDVFDSLPDRPPLQRVWRGTVATNATDFYNRISVILPDLDATLRWENCKWQSRNDTDLPQRGDSCLAIIDNNNEVWVVVWWPFL